LLCGILKMTQRKTLLLTKYQCNVFVCLCQQQDINLILILKW